MEQREWIAALTCGGSEERYNELLAADDYIRQAERRLEMDDFLEKPYAIVHADGEWHVIDESVLDCDECMLYLNRKGVLKLRC